MSGGLRCAGFDAKSFRMVNDGVGDAPKAVGPEGLTTRSSSPPPHPTSPSDVAGGERPQHPRHHPHPHPKPLVSMQLLLLLPSCIPLSLLWCL